MSRHIQQDAGRGCGECTVRCAFGGFDFRAPLRAGQVSLDEAELFGSAHQSRHRPDTPYFLDAAESFEEIACGVRSERQQAGIGFGAPGGSPAGCTDTLASAERTQQEECAKVFDRFAAIVNLSNGATREDILRGDRKGIDAAWDALKLGDTGW